MATVKKTKKVKKKNISNGVVTINSTFNNTIVSISDNSGAVISWGSAGTCGFKGSKKGTPFAAQLAAETAAKKAMDHGMQKVKVKVSGPGAGRETAVRAIQHAGLSVTSIEDITPIPFNGCRARKPRRV